MISIVKGKTEISRYHQVHSNFTLFHTLRSISEGSGSESGIGPRMGPSNTLVGGSILLSLERFYFL